MLLSLGTWDFTEAEFISYKGMGLPGYPGDPFFLPLSITIATLEKLGVCILCHSKLLWASISSFQDCIYLLPKNFLVIVVWIDTNQPFPIKEPAKRCPEFFVLEE